LVIDIRAEKRVEEEEEEEGEEGEKEVKNATMK